MAFKFVAFASLLAAANAGLLGGAPLLRSAPVASLAAPWAAAAPLARTVVAEPYDPNPQYSYGYEVNDPLTGDNHGQIESRSGDVVKGSYALVESDGTRRVVDYSADPINGFNAVVSKQPLVAARIAAPIVTAPQPILRTVAPAPAASYIPAPILRSAAPPVASLAPAPLLRAAAPVALPAGPWAGSPVLRSAPVISGAPLVGPTLRADPWPLPATSSVVRSTPVW